MDKAELVEMYYRVCLNALRERILNHTLTPEQIDRHIVAIINRENLSVKE